MKRFAGPIAIAAIVAMSAPVSAQTARSGASTGATRSGLPERLSGVPPWTMSFTPDGQPDLQGVWSDTSITPLERPRALQGRRYLTDQEVAELKARADRLFNNPKSDFVPGDNLFLALLAGVDEVENPNATGSSLNMVWREVDNRTSLITDPPDGRLPPLTPEGQRRLAANGAANLTTPWQFGQSAPPGASPHKPPAGPDDLSNLLRCITWGVPKIAGNINYTSHYQIVQGPGYVVFLSEVNHEARVIPLDGRAHLPPGIRQWNGDSRGRWDKHTLIVETTNFSPKSYFMGSADRLHLIERFTRTSADTLDYELTIDDPTTWTKPWTALIRLRAAADHVREFACHEGNHHVVRGILGGARADEK
jgi:hypothetical protein